MMIKVPSKIFIAGEYAALKGLPALTVAVYPMFTFTPVKKDTAAFHPKSPAGLLNQNVTGNFTDPFNGVGGMGASTAEFLSTCASKLDLRDFWSIWKTYRNILTAEHNTPSGVDLLTQLQGGYCLTETAVEKLEQVQWPFKNLNWIAVLTGNKVKTHEHLAEALKLDWDQVEKLNRKITEEFKVGHDDRFVTALNDWRQFLLQSGLEVPTTTELIEFFKDIPGVVAVKGCGALGSDVVFVLYEKDSAEYLEKSLAFWEKDQIVRSSQVCNEGLTITEENENFSSL